jgi:hypothetical protein
MWARTGRSEGIVVVDSFELHGLFYAVCATLTFSANFMQLDLGAKHRGHSPGIESNSSKCDPVVWILFLQLSLFLQ